VPEGPGTQGLQPIGLAGKTTQLRLLPVVNGKPVASDNAPTSVTLFDQGLLQVLQASATGLQPKQAYVLALASQADGSGVLEPLANFMANPAGAAIVNAIGPIRQVVQGIAGTETRRYLVIAPTDNGKPAAPVQVQAM
jgi:hypothetical protein